jgi:hypothetical protein
MSRTIFGDAIFAIVFAIVMVAIARFLWVQWQIAALSGSISAS